MADLVSSQVLQKTLDELRNITRIDLCVTNTDGVLLVTTFPETAIDAESIRSFVLSAADSQIVQEYHYFKVYDNQNVEYILISKGSSDDAYMIGKVAVCEIQNLIIAYKERLDKKQLYPEPSSRQSSSGGCLQPREKASHRHRCAPRCLHGRDEAGKDISAQETVKSLFASRPRDFITAVDEKSIIIVKELKDTDTFEDMNQTARMLVDMLNAEAMSQVRVSYGNPVSEIKSVSRSYKEAKMALEVGKIFYADKNVVPYNNLGIGRLIYQLPIPLCEMFMTEVFGENLPDTFDEETLTTINKFFENNLNVSETSRQLYVHRNTLVYRLEKLEKSTGLDIRKFDDALTFKIAMMVVSYMTYMNNSENL